MRAICKRQLLPLTPRPLAGLRFSSCGGNYFLAYFFFLQLSCWLLLTCFYWHNDFFLECQFHDTVILLPNPVIKRIKSIIYWFLERIGLLCLIYLFTLIWYQNPISITSKYNLPSNLDNVVIFWSHTCHSSDHVWMLLTKQPEKTWFCPLKPWQRHLAVSFSVGQKLQSGKVFYLVA